MSTLSGTTVKVETVIWLNRYLKAERQDSKRRGFLFPSEDILVPEGQRTGGVPKPVYVGYVPYDAIAKARVDKDHDGWRLFTFDDVMSVSIVAEGDWHWYPLFAFKQALASMPD